MELFGKNLLTFRHTITSQPRGGHVTEHLTDFDKDWHSGLCSSMLECPECKQPLDLYFFMNLFTFKIWIVAALACCCCCWYVGLVAERAGESFWAGCCNAPIALLAVRSKVRGAFRIRVSFYVRLPIRIYTL